MDPHNEKDQLLSAINTIRLESMTSEQEAKAHVRSLLAPEGTIIKDASGKPKYRVQADGSWRRM